MSKSDRDAEKLARLREAYRGCPEDSDLSSDPSGGIGHCVFLLRMLTVSDAAPDGERWRVIETAPTDGPMVWVYAAGVWMSYVP